MIKKEHTLYVEKYRPSTLVDFVGNQYVKDRIQKYIDDSDLPNLLFYGHQGTGKTTLAKLIITTINCDSLYINASDENGIDTIRGKIKGFASSATFKGIKVIILDEADRLSPESQDALRNITEVYSKFVRFILTCNYIERLHGPLRSRFKEYEISPISKPEVAARLDYILTEEEVAYKPEDLKTIVNTYFPDMRKMLNTIQGSIMDNCFVLDTNSMVNMNYLESILVILKSPNKDSIKNIRQIMADASIHEFQALFSFLYNKVDEFCKDKFCDIVIEINNHQHQSVFCVDKEINAMSLIVNILKIIK